MTESEYGLVRELTRIRAAISLLREAAGGQEHERVVDAINSAEEAEQALAERIEEMIDGE